MISGRYSLDREVGRGGMGAVWLGRDELLGRPVALKRIGLAPGARAPDLERAEREARLAARLSHPHVVVGLRPGAWRATTTGWSWSTSRARRSPSSFARRRPRSPRSRPRRSLGQAADGLARRPRGGHRAPRREAVEHPGHRRRPGEAVRLRDRPRRGGRLAHPDRPGDRLAGVPGPRGRLRAGRPPTRATCGRSGATLFHALSGRPPYEAGDNLLGGLYRIVHEEPPRLPDAGWLASLLEATMTHDPADRWTMDQVRDFLQAGPGAPLPAPLPVRRARHGRARPARPARDPGARRRPWSRRRRRRPRPGDSGGGVRSPSSSASRSWRC